jgi:hypothetical protein
MKFAFGGHGGWLGNLCGWWCAYNGRVDSDHRVQVATLSCLSFNLCVAVCCMLFYYFSTINELEDLPLVRCQDE